MARQLSYFLWFLEAQWLFRIEEVQGGLRWFGLEAAGTEILRFGPHNRRWLRLPCTKASSAFSRRCLFAFLGVSLGECLVLLVYL